MADEEQRLYVCGLPKGYGLFPLKKAIDEVLGEKADLPTIEFVRDDDGKRIDGVAEIILKNNECETLMTEGIEINHRGKIFALEFLTCLPGGSAEKCYEANNQGPHTREHQKTTNRPKSHLRQRPSGEEPSTSAEKKHPPQIGRKKVNPAKKRTTVRSLGADSDDVDSWFDILQQNPNLFCGTGNRCFLLQTSRAITNDSVRAFFEEEESATVDHIYHIPDGILVVFASEEDADLTLFGNSVEIDNKHIQLFAKTVPMVYEDRLVLKGSFDEYGVAKDLLQCCGIEDDVNLEVTKLKSSGFLVEFDRNVDVENILEEIETTDLKEYNPKAFRVCRTDCVKVKNLSKNAKHDAIKLACMNKRNGGGKVTKVERKGKSNEAIVYFADYTDAERIVDRAESHELLVGKNPVDVSLYFHNMSEASDTSDRSEESDDEEEYVPPPIIKKAQSPKKLPKRRTSVREFQTPSSVDVDVISFVRKSKKVTQLLRDQFTGIAELEMIETLSASGHDYKFCFKPVIEDLDDDLKYNQQAFEDSCKTVLDAFLTTFCVKRTSYELSKNVNLRHSLLWNEDHDFHKVEIKGNMVEVYVRWSVTSQVNVKVIGSNGDVTAALDYLLVKGDITKDRMTFQKQHFRALRECNIIPWVEKGLNDVEIRMVEKKENGSGDVVFEGPKKKVKEAKSKMNAAVLEITMRAVPDLGSRSEFLLTALKNDERGLEQGMVDVRQIIQAKLHADKIYASLQLKPDEVCFKYCEVSELEKAQNVLTEIIEQKTIEVVEGFNDVVTTPGWKQLKRNLSVSGSVQIYINKPNSSIDVVGLLKEFRNACQQIGNFIEENVHVIKLFKKNLFVVEYFKNYLKSRKEYDEKTKEVRLDYKTNEGNPHVMVTGKKKPVAAVLDWLDEINKDLYTRKRDISEPGMPEYFKSKKGKDKIEAISQTNRCIGAINPTYVERNKSSSSESVELAEFTNNEPAFAEPLSKPQEDVEMESLIRHGQAPVTNDDVKKNQLKLSVDIGDISTFQADVIVTSTAPYNFASGQGSAISKALVKQAGRDLQESCCAASYKGLKTGDVVPTQGFNLSCHEVYHVMLSKYNHFDSLTKLRKAILKCLDMAEGSGYTSIAFPALGAGGFGFPSNDVVKLLDDIVQSRKDTNLQTVNLVVFNSDTDTLKAIQDELSLTLPQALPTTAPAQTIVQIIVKQADITSTSSKAIVNSTNQFNLSGAVSKAIVAKAGQNIVQELANPQISSTNSMRVTSGGNLCQYILHLNVPRDINQLDKLLVECFCEADRLGVQDLAIPPVGTGGIGLQSGPMAKCLASAIDKFDKTNPAHLKKIEVYVFQGSMLPDFQRELLNPPKPRQGLYSMIKSTAANVFNLTGTSKTPTASKPTSILPKKGSSTTKESVCVLFCSWNLNDVKQALDAVQDVVDELSITKSIKNEAIEELTVEQQRQLLSIMKKSNVIMEKTSSMEITIQGVQNNVLEAYTRANDIVQKAGHALQISEYVAWKYVDHQHSTENDFSAETNYELESAFKKNKKGKFQITATINGKQVELQIDFSKMEATTDTRNISTKYDLKRSIASNVD